MNTSNMLAGYGHVACVWYSLRSNKHYNSKVTSAHLRVCTHYKGCHVGHTIITSNSRSDTEIKSCSFWLSAKIRWVRYVNCSEPCHSIHKGYISRLACFSQDTKNINSYLWSLMSVCLSTHFLNAFKISVAQVLLRKFTPPFQTFTSDLQVLLPVAMSVVCLHKGLSAAINNQWQCIYLSLSISVNYLLLHLPKFGKMKQ